VYEQKQGNASLRLDAEMDDDGHVRIHLSGVALILRVRGQAPLEVDADAGVLRTKGWKVTLAPSRHGKGEQWERRYVLEPPLQPGAALSLEVLPLRYRDGSRLEKKVAWKPIPVRIVRRALSELRGVTPPEEIAAPVSIVPGLASVLAVLLVAAIGLVGWEVWRRRLRRAATLTPAGWALAEMRRASAVDCSTREMAERFATVLSDIIRRYLEMQFRVPASRQTTAEVFERIRQSPQLTSDQQTRVRDFLERCDLAKFARAIPSREECEGLVVAARACVEKTSEPTTLFFPPLSSSGTSC
jgi:hypothetical protein